MNNNRPPRRNDHSPDLAILHNGNASIKPRQFGLPRRRRTRHPKGKVLVLVLISLSSILGILGLVFDAGLLTSDSQDLHHATDAAATAGAMDLLLGKAPASATATAISYVSGLNGLADAQTTVNIPPLQGVFAGQSSYVEVVASRVYKTRLIHMLGANSQQTFSTRSVAGYRPSTTGAAIVVLDPNPSAISINGIPPMLPTYPALIAGLEVLGLGTVGVDGAVLVNTTWGGVDENGNPAGTSSGPPYGISCTPLVSLTHLNARDIRVVGGVDSPSNYGNFSSGKKSPLRANRLAVPDPYQSLPVPTTVSDPAHVNAQLRGGVQVVALPLVGQTVLQPGVYDWIEVVSGQVTFSPGVYIIRSVNPLSGIALNVLAGTVTANGVLFYITNAANYDATTGAPDNDDGSSRPAQSLPTGSIPSVLINATLPGSTYAPLNDPASPFNGLLVYQRRADLRPVVIVQDNLLAAGSLSGALYAKWGHVLFTGSGAYDLKIVAGTVRLVSVLGMTLSPGSLLPPAHDVYLVE
jgi:hypothetical protein